MAGRHLLFVGLSGSGKSTVGQMVADELGVTLFDTDSGVPVAGLSPERRRFPRCPSSIESGTTSPGKTD